MQYTIKKLPKNLVEVSFSVTPEEYAPFLQKAAEDISKERPIQGFRPCKAPHEVVKQLLGEAKILEHTLPYFVKRFYADAVREKKLETLGEPEIAITKLSPGNTLEYKMTVAVLPAVILGDWENISIAHEPTTIGEAEIERTVSDLQKMQTKEVVVQRPAGEKDKVVVDMEMLRGGVSLEGGTAKNHAIYLGEKYYIPGLAEKLIGAAAGETREFSLDFPAEHYQKNVAGRPIDFKIKILDVYELTLPELTDAFAMSLGQKTVADLRSLIGENLQKEAETKQAQREELGALQKIIDYSRFEDIPDVLVNSEAEKMLRELERGVAEQGLEFNQYLAQIKKSVSDLKLEFVPEAMRRVKAALAIRAIAKQKNIEASDKEVVDEVTKLVSLYKDDAAAQKEISSPEYTEQIRAFLVNRKTLELVRKAVVH